MRVYLVLTPLQLGITLALHKMMKARCASLAVLMLAPFAGYLMQMAMSRNREYLADASSVELTRDPYGLERALAAIDLATDLVLVASLDVTSIRNLGKEVVGKYYTVFAFVMVSNRQINFLSYVIFCSWWNFVNI